jgi:hypothetical protein
MSGEALMCCADPYSVSEAGSACSSVASIPNVNW